MTEGLEMHKTLITRTSEILSAHVGNNSVAVADLTTLIAKVYNALAGLDQPAPIDEAAPEPAVSVRASIKNDYIVCLEDGKKLKMLKRHLATSYNMTPDQYRARWNLPVDYPMVAPACAEKRRELAKKIGLGRKPEGKPGQSVGVSPQWKKLEGRLSVRGLTCPRTAVEN